MSVRRTALAAAGVVAMLAGCEAVNPDYRRPDGAIVDRPAANAPFHVGRPDLFASTELPTPWWRLYRDPVLDGLIAQALAANVDLRVAAANLAKAQAAADFAASASDPTTTVSAAPGYGRRSAEEELIKGGPLPNTFTYGVGFGVSYQFDLFGQISRAVEASRADVHAARAAYDATRVTVVAEVTRDYLESCSAGREALVAQRSADIQAKSRVLTERLVAGGRAISLDQVRAVALEEQVKATLPRLQARKQLALYRLAVLAGRLPSETSEAVAACVQEPRLDQAIPIGDGASLLKRRPDIRQAEGELESAHARVGVAMSDLYPKISFGASIGSVGLDQKFLDDSTIKFSVGPLLTWQFPDRSRTKARVRGAEAEEAAAYAKFDRAVLAALRETESALTVYAQDLDARALLESSRKRSVQAAEQTTRLFKAGRIAFLPVLDANRARISAEQAVAAADSKLATDQVDLFLALGGGWETDLRASSP